MERESKFQAYIDETINDLSSKPWFPTNYCNVAAKHLFNILMDAWEKNIRLQYSYTAPKDWHTYVVLTQEDWTDIILDPTYSQYHPEYSNWFIWEHFPDEKLEKNRMDQKDYKKKREEWLDEWINDNL